MDLNAILFPSPSMDHCIEDFEGEMIFVPKKLQKYNPKKYIPCIFLQSKLKSISKYYLVFFHGNAEDIFIAKDIGEKIKNHLYVKT